MCVCSVFVFVYAAIPLPTCGPILDVNKKCARRCMYVGVNKKMGGSMDLPGYMVLRETFNYQYYQPV